jgi:hypothetical protein
MGFVIFRVTIRRNRTSTNRHISIFEPKKHYYMAMRYAHCKSSTRVFNNLYSDISQYRGCVCVCVLFTLTPRKMRVEPWIEVQV